MDAASVLERLRERVDADGSARVFATRTGLSPAYVLDVLKGRRMPGPRMLDALGIERRVTYHEKA